MKKNSKTDLKIYEIIREPVPYTVKPYLHSVLGRYAHKVWMEEFYQDYLKEHIFSHLDNYFLGMGGELGDKLLILHDCCRFVDRKSIAIDAPAYKPLRHLFNKIPDFQRKLENAYFQKLQSDREATLEDNLPANLPFYLKAIIRESIAIYVAKVVRTLKNYKLSTQEQAQKEVIEKWFAAHLLEYSACKGPIQTSHRPRPLNWFFYLFIGVARFNHLVYYEIKYFRSLWRHFKDSLGNWQKNQFSIMGIVFGFLKEAWTCFMHLLHYAFLPMRIIFTISRDAINYTSSILLERYNLNFLNSLTFRVIGGTCALLAWGIGAYFIMTPMLAAVVSNLANMNYLLFIGGICSAYASTVIIVATVLAKFSIKFGTKELPQEKTVMGRQYPAHKLKSAPILNMYKKQLRERQEKQEQSVPNIHYNRNDKRMFKI